MKPTPLLRQCVRQRFCCSSTTSISYKTTRTRFSQWDTRQAVRLSSSQAQPITPDKGSESPIRVSTLFTALLCLGVGATAFGLYDLYSTMTMWPQEVRGDLRAAITAKNQGNLDVSERYFQRALETAKTLPLETLEPEPHLKLSGISIALAEVQESRESPEHAYQTYSDALSSLQGTLSTLSGTERLRAVAIATKLGEMAETYQLPADEEEKWLTWAVNEVLRIAKEQQPSLANKPSDTDSLMIAELNLPKWITATDIGGPLSALGSFYSRTGKIEYAMPLYLHAISTLMPPASQKKSTSYLDQCKGAQLMTALSELIVRDTPSPDKLHQSEAWGLQAVGILEKVIKSGQQISECDEALVFAYFNLASLREMAGDISSSRKFYESSLNQSKKIEMREGILKVETALRRLDRVERAATRVNPLTEEKSG